jgi:hypothetical protein
MLMLRISPEAQNPALVTAVKPLACINSSACIQRGDEFIPTLVAAGGKFLIAGKLQPYSFYRHAIHSLSPVFCNI